MRAVLGAVGHVSVITARCAWSHSAGQRGSKGKNPRFLKPYKFEANGPWIRSIARTCTCGPRAKHVPLTVETIVRGRRRYTGVKWALRLSAAYPDALGSALLTAGLPCIRGCGQAAPQRPMCPPAQRPGNASAASAHRPVRNSSPSAKPTWLQPPATQAPTASARNGSPPAGPAWLLPAATQAPTASAAERSLRKRQHSSSSSNSSSSHSKGSPACACSALLWLRPAEGRPTAAWCEPRP